MAAGNRKNPVRCFSSDSRYSLMEFEHEFPDDEACPQWLWKTRVSATAPTGAARALSEVQRRAVLQTLCDEPATAIVDVHRLRSSSASDSGHNLSQIIHVTTSLVLRDVHDHKHPMRYLRETARPRIGRYVQNGLAHFQSNPILALRWLYASECTRS